MNIINKYRIKNYNLKCLSAMSINAKVNLSLINSFSMNING